MTSCLWSNQKETKDENMDEHIDEIKRFLIFQDYDVHDNKTSSRKRDRDLVEQEDCGKFASQQPGRNSICKINKEELFQVCVL